MLAPAADKSISVLDSVILSLVGFLIVFIALIALIAAIKVITLLAERKKKEAGVRVDFGKSANILSAPVADMIPAAGSLGELDLYDVDDCTAALIMAIVADDLKVPLNTLRFKSIRQIEIGEEK